MNADKGVKLYDKQAVEALPKEFAQLDDMNTFKPIMPNFMKREECRKKILWLMNLVKEKGDVTIKAKGARV